MLVTDCMKRHPIMIAPTLRASEAQQIMDENKIRHLPVVEKGKSLQGLIHASKSGDEAYGFGQPECLGDHKDALKPES